MKEITNIQKDAQFTLREFLEYDIISFGKHHISVYEILGAVLALIIGFIVSLILKRLVYNLKK